MKSTIGVYDSHDKAVEAVRELKEAGFPENQLSIIGHAEVIDDHMHVKDTSGAISRAEVGMGVVAGSVVGLLTGIGIFAIPGLGFLYGAGALVGAFAGLDFGIMGGGLVAILTGLGINQARAHEYKKHLEDGNFIVVVQGTEDEIHRAEEVLSGHGTHVELDKHGVAA